LGVVENGSLGQEAPVAVRPERVIPVVVHAKRRVIEERCARSILEEGPAKRSPTGSPDEITATTNGVAIELIAQPPLIGWFSLIGVVAEEAPGPLAASEEVEDQAGSARKIPEATKGFGIVGI